MSIKQKLEEMAEEYAPRPISKQFDRFQADTRKSFLAGAQAMQKLLVEAAGDWRTNARFWSKVNVPSKNSCWKWNGSVTPQGYGSFWNGVKKESAHRYAYKIAKGQPGELWIDHICMNKICVNPDHLRAVTPLISSLENSLSPSAVNAKKSHCKHGHEFTKSNTRIKVRNGRAHRDCKLCEKASKRRARERQRASKR